MLLSLAVLLVPIAVFLLLWNFLADGNQSSVVDPEPSFSQAASKGVDVLRPHGLSQDWSAMRSAVDEKSGDVVVRVGYNTPSDAGIQLVETDADAEDLLAAELSGKAKPTGAAELANGDWQVYATKGGNAMVLSHDGSSVLIHGDAEVDELNSFAKTLK